MVHSTLMLGGEILLGISITIFVGALIATLSNRLAEPGHLAREDLTPID